MGRCHLIVIDRDWKRRICERTCELSAVIAPSGGESRKLISARSCSPGPVSSSRESDSGLEPAAVVSVKWVVALLTLALVLFPAVAVIVASQSSCK